MVFGLSLSWKSSDAYLLGLQNFEIYHQVVVVHVSESCFGQFLDPLSSVPGIRLKTTKIGLLGRLLPKRVIANVLAILKKFKADCRLERIGKAWMRLCRECLRSSHRITSNGTKFIHVVFALHRAGLLKRCLVSKLTCCTLKNAVVTILLRDISYLVDEGVCSL